MADFTFIISPVRPGQTPGKIAPSGDGNRYLIATRATPQSIVAQAYAASAGKLAGDRHTLALELLDGRGSFVAFSSVENATIQESLDEVGSASVVLPASMIAQVERSATIRLRDSNGTLLLSGFITDVSRGRTPGSDTLTLTAFDDLNELQHVTTLPDAFRSEGLVPAARVVEQLCRLADWTSITTTARATLLSLDLAGTSVLSAVREIAEVSGMHFRRGNGRRILEFGALGQDAGTLPRSAALSEVKVTNRHELVNWIIPWAGDPEYRVTLQHATLGQPYRIMRVKGEGGQDHFAIADQVSIARYGRIEAVVQADVLFALGPAGRANVADSLYLWAASWLRRNSVEVSSRQARLAGVDHGARVGDVLQVQDEPLFVIARTRRWTSSFIDTVFELSNLDAHPVTPDQLLARELRRRPRSLRSQIDLTTLRVTGSLDVGQADHEMTLVLEIPQGVIDIPRTSIRLERDNVAGPSLIGVIVDGQALPGEILATRHGGLVFTRSLIDLLVVNPGEHYISVRVGAGEGLLRVEVDATVARLI